MNGAEVKKHLANFIAINERMEFGLTAIQMDCRIGRHEALRVMEAGIKSGDFLETMGKFRVMMERDYE